MTDSAVTHGTDGFKALGSGFESELSREENHAVRVALALYVDRLSPVLTRAIAKLEEQWHQRGWH
jgi:hypothetical protein